MTKIDVKQDTTEHWAVIKLKGYDWHTNTFYLKLKWHEI